MAKETFEKGPVLSNRGLGKLLLIGSIKKSLGLSFHKDINGYSVIDLSYYNANSEITGP